MKRRLTKLVVFLLLGAVVNVAVGWGLASLFGPRGRAVREYADMVNEVGYAPAEFVYGWPLVVLTCDSPIERGMFITPIEYHYELLSLTPIWLGFALNTVFYAAILWLLTLGPFTARRLIRRKRGHCIKCGYDLRGTSGGVCPECGWGRPAFEQ